jgi:hypothetical protein
VDVVAQQPPAGELEERDEQVGQFALRIAVARRTRQLPSHGGEGLWALRWRCGVGGKVWKVLWGRCALRGGGFADAVKGWVDQKRKRVPGSYICTFSVERLPNDRICEPGTVSSGRQVPRITL